MPNLFYLLCKRKHDIWKAKPCKLFPVRSNIFWIKPILDLREKNFEFVILIIYVTTNKELEI